MKPAMNACIVRADEYMRPHPSCPKPTIPAGKVVQCVELGLKNCQRLARSEKIYVTDMHIDSFIPTQFS